MEYGFVSRHCEMETVCLILGEIHVAIPADRGLFIARVSNQFSVSGGFLWIIFTPMAISAQNVAMSGFIEFGCIDQNFFPDLQRRYVSTSTFT
jgi:hypothetical protein